jgi:lactate dehydrogenase-like 2-hydroxyacid dehydrogenase
MLGIIGMGRIGQATDARAKGFNMPIYYLQSPSPLQVTGA